MIKLNGRTVEFTQFPNGETNVNGDALVQSERHARLTLKYTDDSDLVKLMFIKKHLDSFGVRTSLTITYMPYSRQDRVEGNSVFTLKYIAEFINNLRFSSVRIIEPHSDVTMALVDNSVAKYPTLDLLGDVKEFIDFNNDTDYIFYPDAGAAKRYQSKISANNVLVGFKDRDFATGHIKSLQVVGEVKSQNFKVIIIDDLCSHGGTFVMAAEELRKRGATEVYLLVTHCEDTILEGSLLQTNRIDKVFTTDSILSYEHSKINVFKGGNI